MSQTTKNFWANLHGEDVTKAAGNRFWEEFQDAADSYPCSPCKPGAQALAHGGHDVINVLLGKPVKTPEHFENLYQMVTEAYERVHGGHKHTKHEEESGH